MVSKLATPTKDEGECVLNADFATGKVAVTVRAPLAIDKRTVEVPITEFLELTTQIMLASFQMARQVREQLLKGQKTGA